VPTSIRPGDVLADRYRLVDLLSESGGGRFWRAHDRILERHVALHVISADDARAEGLLTAARRSATVLDQHILRVLDAERTGQLCYVVNEWGSGTSLDIMLAAGGVLAPRRAAWLVGEVAAACAIAHSVGVAHGRLNPENVLIDTSGAVRVIGWCVDAALHGRPEGRASEDVADLAGLLYAALTGKWAGPSASAVPLAPTDHGRVLRPRQVRAGIPRTLDALCDEVLNPQDGPRSVQGASDIRYLLEDFVGDPAGIQESMVSRLVSRSHEKVVLPSVPEFGLRLPGTTEPEGPSEPDASLAPAQEDEPTQMSLPSLDPADDPAGADDPADDRAADPSEHATTSTPAAPPPPLEEPPARPLFAPDPIDGAPARTPRPRPQGAAPSQSYWPWETTGHAAVDSTGGWGTGWSTGTQDPVEEEVPGRNTFRLAAVLLACLLLLVAIAVAFNIGRGRTPLGAVPEESSPTTAAPTQAASAEPLRASGATDLDPQGDDGDENGDLAPLAVDGDPTTTWRTSTYVQQFGPGGLKTGVGLVVDLGQARTISAVELAVVGDGTAVQVFVTDQAPTDVAGLTPAVTAEVEPRTRVDLDAPAEGRFVTVWLTALPAVDGGFRGEVGEISVLG
jgi:hypothetical protein